MRFKVTHAYHRTHTHAFARAPTTARTRTRTHITNECADTFESLRREKTEQEAEVCREEYLASLVALLTQLPKANLDLLFYILKFCNKLRYPHVPAAHPTHQRVRRLTSTQQTANRPSRPR